MYNMSKLDVSSSSLSSIINSMGNSSTTSTMSTTSTILNMSTIPTEFKKNGYLVHHFPWYDYIFFFGMLCVSTAVGIYYGFIGKKQSTAKDYLLGGKKMKVIPISISLISSHVSGVSLMAMPADVYMFGASYGLCFISVIVLAFATSLVFLPVFFNLKITSTYEYLEMRFDSRCRKWASVLYAISVIVQLPLIVYIPSLAFATSSGISVNIICPVICCICTFYTAFGGLKALVKNDSIQFTVTAGSMIVLLALGLHSLGVTNFWNLSVDSGRLDVFDFDFDLTKRESFWCLAVGFSIHLVACSSVNQGCIQKFIAVPTLKESILAAFLYSLGLGITKVICVIIGLIIAAKYSTCDPILTNQIEKKDQLMTYYVMDVASKVPGLAGLFTAGIFSAALSSMSGYLNTLAATIYEDFAKDWLETHNVQRTAGYTLKIIVILIGTFITGLVFLVPHLGGVFGLSIALGSVAHGPTLGIFILGLLFPRSNAKGAFYGAVTGILSTSIIIIGARFYIAQGVLRYDQKPRNIDECDPALNLTENLSNITTNNSSRVESYVPVMFRLSFYWYAMVGTCMCIVVGLVVSYMTNKNHPPVDRQLISPVARFLLPKKDGGRLGEPYEYKSVEKAMDMVTVERDILNEARKTDEECKVTNES